MHSQHCPRILGVILVKRWSFDHTSTGSIGNGNCSSTMDTSKGVKVRGHDLDLQGHKVTTFTFKVEVKGHLHWCEGATTRGACMAPFCHLNTRWHHYLMPAQCRLLTHSCLCVGEQIPSPILLIHFLEMQ